MADGHFSRRAEPPNNSLIWRERLSEWSVGIALAGSIVLVLAMIYGWMHWRQRDAADAPLQTARAIVTGKSLASWNGKPGYGWNMQLQFNHQSAVANTRNVALFNRVQIGDTVSIAYKVGKSGAIYIEELAPQPEQHATIASPAARH